MADEQARALQYAYTANASLVISGPRGTRRDQEPDGNPESLAGRIKKDQMGDRAKRTIDEKRDQIQKRQQTKQAKLKASGADRSATSKAKKEKESSNRYGHRSILDATEDFEGEIYKPRTKETRQTYELILSTINSYLGDVAPDTLRGAADQVLEILKGDKKKDFDKKKGH